MHLRIWCIGRLDNIALLTLRVMYRSAQLMAFVAAARRFQLYWIYVVLLVLVLIAWMARWPVERRRGLISISDLVCCVGRSSASSISF